MSRLIDADRQVTVTYYDEEYEEWSQKTRTIWDTILEVADEIPPVVDAVPVVRCRDCECWYPEEDDDYGHCRRYDFWTSENWYCADGKRREDGKH